MNRKLLAAGAISSEAVAEALRSIRRGSYYSPFVVVGNTSPFFPDAGIASWQIIISPAQGDSYGVVEESIAKGIIERYKMHRAASKLAGRVYELPGDPFFKQWRGYYTTKALAQIWGNINHYPGYPWSEAEDEIWAEGTDKSFTLYAPKAVCRFVEALLKKGISDADPLRRLINNRKIIFKSINL